MQNPPFPIDVHAVVGDKSSLGKFPVPLRTPILRRVAELRQPRIPRLQPIFQRRLLVCNSRQVFRVIFLGSLQRVRQSYSQRRSGLLRRLRWIDQLYRWLGSALRIVLTRHLRRTAGTCRCYSCWRDTAGLHAAHHDRACGSDSARGRRVPRCTSRAIQRHSQEPQTPLPRGLSRRNSFRRSKTQ